MATCPALLVSGPSSGVGKTTVTAALALRYRQQGLRVRVFKTGPDFLDPLILERASGHPVYQLDLWMTGEDDCRQRLAAAAAAADLILVEGVMGLYDGVPSSADLAARFGIPLLLVIDAAAMGQTFGAIAHGLASFRAGLSVAGAFANRVAGPGHAALLAPSLPAGLSLQGYLLRDAEMALPDRHLGLVQADEVGDLEARFDRLDRALTLSTGEITSKAMEFQAPSLPPLPRSLAGVRIAVAKDTAFFFIYPANLDLLASLGADICFFSPVAGEALPACDALWLPGGYPELHLDRLAAADRTMSSIRAHHQAGKPILAECGGLMFLTESLTDIGGTRRPMTGLVRGHTVMQSRLAALAMQSVVFPEGELRGHSFHYSRLEDADPPFARGRPSQSPGPGEAVFRSGRLTASYVHFYLPSCPAAAAALFRPGIAKA